MELFSMEFFSALFAIIIIDLILAGDNAIVIALAARNLPEHLRRKAIIWGTVGAIVVRSAMTLIVVWLLKIPGLLLAGGALLLWIAYKLLTNQDEGEGHGVSPASNFWAAMKTIVIADAVMGLDNVLAVAGAAHGSFLLVVLGLLISIPIVIWGSQIILKFVHKYPSIVYLGAAVLVWTGIKMMTSEPLVKDYAAAAGSFIALAYVLGVGGVLFAGFWSNHRTARTRVAAHAVNFADESAITPPTADTGPQGGSAMKKVLIPIDGSASAMQAVRYVVNQITAQAAMEVHLLHVRAPFSHLVSLFTSKQNRRSYHVEMAEKALTEARELLNRHGVPHAVHIELGGIVEVIDRVAQRLHVDQIVMGTARRNTLTRIVQDSITAKVMEAASMPVLVVAGGPAARWERIGVPAAAGAVLAVFLVSAVLG